MAEIDRTPQPLANNFKIVDDAGFPTDYFIRWCQDRQIAIQDGITAVQAQQLIDDWAAARTVTAGVGLDGGGTLDADITIDLADTAVAPATYGDATHSAQLTIDQQGRVTAAVDVPISGGGGGGSHPWWWSPPLAANLNNFYSGGAGGNITNTDDTDIGLIASCPMAGGQQIKLCTEVLPAGDFTLTAHIIRNFPTNFNYGGFGIGVYETATTKWLSLIRREGTNLNYRGGTSLTSTSVDTNGADSMTEVSFFMRIKRVGALITFQWSYDGKNFMTAGSSSTHFTTAPDRIGLVFFGEASASAFSPLIGDCDMWQHTY